MNTTHKEMVEQLEEILEKNIDAQKGYAKAADNADSTALKSYFQRKSEDRKQFNIALKNALVANYDEIEEDGSFTGTIHRAWMDIKAMFSADNDESMLEEAIRGDKASVEEYEEVLKETALPANISTLIRNQQMKIRTDLNNIKSLEDLK